MIFAVDPYSSQPRDGLTADATIGGSSSDKESLQASRPRPPRRRVGSAAPLLSIAEVANLLGVHRSTLYRTIARSKLPLPIVRIGATMRIPRAAINRMLDTELPKSVPSPLDALPTSSVVSGPACRCHACGSPLTESRRPTCSAARRSSSSTASV
jgi:excisionase family DNA binding protein